MSIVAKAALCETWQVPSKLCVKNYKHLRRIKNMAALYLAETKGTDGSLEVSYMYTCISGIFEGVYLETI